MPATVSFHTRPGAVTRALVIGVGHYPSLPGGGGPEMTRPEGLRQLQSPPVSARAFARWLIEHYDAPARPLASVHVLISETAPQPLEYTRDGQVQVAQPMPGHISYR